MAVTTGESRLNSAITDVIDHGSVKGLQILIICIALLLNMLDGFDVTAMAFTVHSIGEELQITPDRLGIVFSVALAGMMIGAMFIAPLSDTIGRRKMVLVCVAVIGLSMCATGFASQLWQLIILRFITGLAVGGMLASLATIASEFTPEKYRSLAVVSITAGYPLGASLGGFLAAPLIPAYGWESVFFAGGLATLVMVIPVYFLVPESIQFLLAKRPAGALEKINAVMARLDGPALNELPAFDEAQSIDKANVTSLLTEERRKQTLMLWTTFFFCFVCLYFLMSWIPKLVINSGLSETLGVYAATAFNGGGAIGIVTLGWLAARFKLSNLIGSFLIVAAAIMVLFALASGVNHLLLYLIVIGFFLQSGFTGLYAVSAKIYPTEVRATGVGWAIGLGRFGAVVGPYVGGILIAMNVSMEMNFIFFCVPLVIAGLLAYRLGVH